MEEMTTEQTRRIRSVKTLAMVNVGIWAIAIVAMVFLAQDSPAAKKLFPILGGGVAVGVALITALAKAE